MRWGKTTERSCSGEKSLEVMRKYSVNRNPAFGARFGLVLAALCVGEAHADLSDGGHYGNVVDAEDGRPVAEAKVVARWHVAWSGLATSGERCVKVIVTDADREGRFALPAWKASDTAVESFYLEVSAYRTGFRLEKAGLVVGGNTWTGMFGFSGSKNISPGRVDVRMKRDGGTPRERMKYLAWQVAQTSCNVRSGDAYFFVKALYDEALALPADAQGAPIGSVSSIEWLRLRLEDERKAREDPKYPFAR